MCWRQFLIPGSDPGEMFANDTGVWRSVETTGDMRGLESGWRTCRCLQVQAGQGGLKMSTIFRGNFHF